MSSRRVRPPRRAASLIGRVVWESLLREAAVCSACPTGADPIVRRGFLRYVKAWYATGHVGLDPVSALLMDRATPPPPVAESPDRFIAWAETLAAACARSRCEPRAPLDAGPLTRIEDALRACATAVRIERRVTAAATR